MTGVLIGRGEETQGLTGREGANHVKMKTQNYKPRDPGTDPP